MTLGNKIAYLRKQQGLTQEALAQKLEVTNQAVSKWESDTCCPDIALLPKLADVFGVTIDALFGREPQAEPAQEEQAAPVKKALDMGMDALDIGMDTLNRLFGEQKAEEGKAGFSFEKTFHVSLGEAEKKAKEKKASEEGFRISMEELEKEAKEKQSSWKFQEVDWSRFDTSKMDWEDDGVLRVVLLAGRKLLMGTPMAEKIEFRFDGPAQTIYSQCNVVCYSVGGDVYAGGNVTCDDVEGDIHAQGSVTCDCVEGAVIAGGTVTCDEINGGTVRAERDVECDEMHDCTVYAGGDLRCEEFHDCSIECMGSMTGE